MSHCPGALSVRAHAKINLGLRVTGLTGDGYHLVRSILQVIDLHDELTFHLRADWPADRVRIICDDPAVPSGESSAENLIARAALAVPPPCGIKVHLRKRIPVGAGLGGGSSDAAATLAVLSRIMARRNPAEVPDIEQIARELGADVPFFLRGGTQEAAGRGDMLRSLPFPGPHWVLLACPPVRLSTAAVYAAYDQLEDKPVGGMSPATTVTRLRGDDLAGVLTTIRNDLEEAALRCEPGLSLCRDRLAAAAGRTAVMTGSGSGFFTLYRHGGQARRAYSRLTGDHGLGPGGEQSRLFLGRFRRGGGWEITSDGGGSGGYGRQLES